MGAFNYSTTSGRPEPFVISVVRVGETRERFIARNGNVIAFDEDTGVDIPYISKITDANGKVSTKQFNLTCERPANCTEGPRLDEIIEFNPHELTYQFHGVNVTQIERQIISENGIIVDSAIDIPSSAIVKTTFTGELARGKYFLKIRGKSCYSEQTNGLEFTITDDSTELDWWENYPRFDYDAVADSYRILMAVTRAGTYPYAIKDDLGAVIVSGSYTLSPGQILDFAGYDPGEYDLELGPLTFTMIIDEPPAECDEGPILLSVTSISATQTRFNFDGLNVFVIEWFIRDPSDVIQERGTVEPGGAVVTINHDALAAGTHNLLIKGSSCTSETGVVDNLDFVVAGTTLAISSVGVEQQSDGRYKLLVNFSGGNPNYTITVRTAANVTLGAFPNTTGSPASVLLPAGTTPQTVKVMVMDVNNNVDEETGVILPAPVMKMTFLQAPNFSAAPTRTAMENDGSTFFIGSDANYNWDVDATFPNGGLVDYIEKRLRKKVGGVWVEKSITTATGQNQSYSIGSSSGSERLFMPRNGNTVTIDGVNVFKTAGEWEFRAIARKGGVSGAIVSQLTRNFTVSAPSTLSGIFLYDRTTNIAGAEIAQLNSTGSSFPKPVPYYDLVVKDFGGVTFNKIIGTFKRKVGDLYLGRHAISSEVFSPAKTTIAKEDFSMFWLPVPGPETWHPDVLAQEVQTWEVEFIAYMNDTVVGNRKAIFEFTVNTSVEQGFTNRGFKRTVVSGKAYQQINGIDFGSEILPSGNVKIFYPASRPSINGQKTCYPWVYMNHVRMHSDDLAAARSGSGLALPNGKHNFSVKYHSNAVASYDDVITGGTLGGPYQLAGEIRAISFANSAMDDYFTVTIRNA